MNIVKSEVTGKYSITGLSENEFAVIGFALGCFTNSKCLSPNDKSAKLEYMKEESFNICKAMCDYIKENKNGQF